MHYFLLALTLLFLAPASPLTPDPPVKVRWVSVSGDRLAAVAGYTVVEYRNAGAGGLEWVVSGEGQAGGNGPSQLWLLEAPVQASVVFTAPSEAVAFMTAGDSNDGFATFLVDGVEIGTYNMYRRGEQTLVAEGLERVPHRLEIRADGRKVSRSQSAHVALYGGAALSNEQITETGHYAAPELIATAPSQ